MKKKMSPITIPEPVMFDASKLINADYNPREIAPQEMKRLKRSIEEYGFVQPVVARKTDNLIIAGHQRLEAFKQLYKGAVEGIKVPVVFLDISDESAKLLNVALNKISGAWDYDKLGALFASLDKVGGQDLELSGFSSNEIADMLALLNEPISAPSDLDANLDDLLNARGRRFVFQVADDMTAALCKRALTSFGMTGPGNAGAAFAAMARAALKVGPPKPDEAGKKKTLTAKTAAKRRRTRAAA